MACKRVLPTGVGGGQEGVRKGSGGGGHSPAQGVGLRGGELHNDRREGVVYRHLRGVGVQNSQVNLREFTPPAREFTPPT
eukprot:1059277-Prorocentrum_minimum.AAC.1